MVDHISGRVVKNGIESEYYEEKCIELTLWGLETHELFVCFSMSVTEWQLHSIINFQFRKLNEHVWRFKQKKGNIKCNRQK